jgi:hypothetical protein
MNVIDLLKSESTALPRPPRQTHFLDALCTLFDEYDGLIGQLDEDDPITKAVRESAPAIHRLGGSIVEIVRLSLCGQPSRARIELDNAVAAVCRNIDYLISVPIKDDSLGTLYRIREAHANKGLSRKDIFHIPFEDRAKVRPQRFSVLGVPMLYMGSTLYVCWEELDRPDFQSLWVSGFRLKKKMKVRLLNLAYRPGLVATILEGGGYPHKTTQLTEISVSYCVLWPLLAACTFQVPDPTLPFVVEYVVPQTLMSWVAENDDFDGIRYFSSIHTLPPAATWAIINYVLPAQDVRTSGHSHKLAGLLELTEPVAWSYAEAVGTLTTPVYHGRLSAVLKLAEGHGVPYETTRFAMMEARLEQLPFGDVS